MNDVERNSSLSLNDDRQVEFTIVFHSEEAKALVTLEKPIREEPDVRHIFLTVVENYLKLVSYSEGVSATSAGGVIPFISYVPLCGHGAHK